MPVERPEAFRHVLGHLATGVAVIAATDRGEPVGMSCNSFTSVSLDPPLVSFCAAATSNTWPRIRASGRFAVNVLAGHQEPIGRRFSTIGVDRFAGIGWRPGRLGSPVLDDAVAWLDCRIEDEHLAGDHTIVVGRVEELGLGAAAREPLVFHRGAYRGLESGTPRSTAHRIQ